MYENEQNSQSLPHGEESVGLFISAVFVSNRGVLYPATDTTLRKVQLTPIRL